MAFARTVATTHTKTLIAPSTGVADKVYGADYVSPTSHTSTGAVSDATSGGIPYFSSATTEASSALLAANAVVLGGGAGAAPLTSSKLSEGSAAGAGLSIVAGTATTDVNALSITQTWNNAGVTFKGVRIVITETARTYGSAPFQVLGGAAGTTNLLFTDVAGGAGTWSGSFRVGSTPPTGAFTMGMGVAASSDFITVSGGVYSFSSSTTNAGTAADTWLNRAAANVVGSGTAAGNTLGSFRGKYQSSDGTAGVASFGPSVVTSITVKDGIITAIS